MNVNQTREYYMETEAQDLRKEGLGYLGMTERCIEKAKFTPEIVYDFFLMGAEKCLVSVLLDHGEMPIHHTLEALMDSVKAWEPVPEKMKTVLLAIESKKDICSIIKEQIVNIDESIYPQLLQGTELVQKFLLGRTISRKEVTSN
jgi:hypothetical protein